VVRCSHRDSVEDLARKGRDLGKVVRRARCAGTSTIACWSTATRPSFSADPRVVSFVEVW
jgi:hypothetical protein